MKKSPETDMDTGDLPARLDPVQPERLPSPAGSFDAIARYAPPAAGAPQDGDVLADLRRYLSAVWRYKWAVTGITVLGTAAGVAGKMLLPPNYVARATVWIQVPARPTRDEGPIWSASCPSPPGGPTCCTPTSCWRRWCGSSGCTSRPRSRATRMRWPASASRTACEAARTGSS